MRHDYQRLIEESEEELLALERKYRNSVMASRLQMLRFLRSGEARSVQEAADLIGYSWRHCQRWLTSYQREGLAALLMPPKKAPGPSERMTEEAWCALGEAMKRGEIAGYRQARELLAEHGVKYQDDTSILKLFRRHKIKAKTGRHRHQKADPKEQEAFKKNLCRAAKGTPASADSSSSDAGIRS